MLAMLSCSVLLTSRASFVPTALPSKPQENARVIVAPCSPLMAAQQQWSVPLDSTPAPLELLSAPGMRLYLQPVRQQIGLAAVIRTGTQNASIWRYNKLLSVLELASPGPRQGPVCTTCSTRSSATSRLETAPAPAGAARCRGRRQAQACRAFYTTPAIPPSASSTATRTTSTTRTIASA